MDHDSFIQLWGNFQQPDPRAESFSSITPYQYGLNNPILNIDPTGMYTQSYIKKTDGTREYTIPSADYNAEMDRSEDNPVYGSDGCYRGNTNEGFTGEVIIYDGKKIFPKCLVTNC